jgi:hypothetical protein
LEASWQAKKRRVDVSILVFGYIKIYLFHVKHFEQDKGQVYERTIHYVEKRKYKRVYGCHCEFHHFGH